MIREAHFDASTHTYRCPKSGLVVPSVTQCLSGVGLTDYGKVRQSVLAHKSDIGSEVDFLCVALDKGENLVDYEYDPRLQSYLDSYQEFIVVKKWQAEKTNYGPFIADVAAMPCGFTVDAIGKLDGQEAVCERKCTTNDEPSHAIQTAGYDCCLGEGRRRFRFSLRLQPDGKLAKMTPHTQMSDYGIFISALSITWFKRNHKIGDWNGNGTH